MSLVQHPTHIAHLSAPTQVRVNRLIHFITDLNLTKLLVQTMIGICLNRHTSSVVV